MIIKQGLMWAINELKKNDVSEPEGSATLLLANVLGKDRAYIYAHGEGGLSVKQLDLFKKYIERRKTHEPVWYILGEVEFYGRKFLVNNDVLTPRSETEFLVREILQMLNSKSETLNKFKTSNNQINIIELGTGSGAIAITLAKELDSFSVISAEAEIQKDTFKGLDFPCGGNDKESAIKIIATDISAKTLMVARKNAKIHGVEKDIEFLQGDLLEPIERVISRREESLTTYPDKSRRGSFLHQNDIWRDTIIIANLPYIPHEDMESLQFDVLHHEPRVALDGGKQGIEIYERLLYQMQELGFSGMAFFEIGNEQGKMIKNIVQKNFPKAFVEIKKDLANIDRIMIIEIKT